MAGSNYNVRSTTLNSTLHCKRLTFTYNSLLSQVLYSESDSFLNSTTRFDTTTAPLTNIIEWVNGNCQTAAMYTNVNIIAWSRYSVLKFLMK